MVMKVSSTSRLDVMRLANLLQSLIAGQRRRQFGPCLSVSTGMLTDVESVQMKAKSLYLPKKRINQTLG